VTVERIRMAGTVAWAFTGMAVMVALLLFLGYTVRVIWPPLVLAGIIVFLLNPVVTALQRRHVPRALGTAATYLGVAGVVVLAGFLIAPQARAQWNDLSADWPELRDKIEKWVDDRAEDSQENDWPVEIPTFAELEDTLSNGPDAADADHDGEVTAEERQERLFDTIDNAREIGLRIFHVGLIFVLAPIIAFYLLVDLPHIRRVTQSLIPEDRKAEVLLVGRRLAHAISGYFRGQLFVAAIVGTMASIGLAILGLPFWLVIGMVAGIFNMIPMIGPWIGAVPGVIIALTTRDVGTAVWVVGIMAGVQQIDNHFISPVVMQRAVKLHPAVVMLTLLAGGTLGGFFGLLLAVPLVAVLKVLLGHLWRTYILNQPLEQEALAFAAMDAQPGAVVEDIDDRREDLDRLAYPVEGDPPTGGGVATATATETSTSTSTSTEGESAGDALGESEGEAERADEAEAEATAVVEAEIEDGDEPDASPGDEGEDEADPDPGPDRT
jgi:predicted PurR-regulated permease PerM